MGVFQITEINFYHLETVIGLSWMSKNKFMFLFHAQDEYYVNCFGEFDIRITGILEVNGSKLISVLSN